MSLVSPPHNAQLAADAVMLRRLSSPPRVACSTVQLVAKCQVSPSLYSGWLRPEPSSWAVEVIAIRLVRDHKWSPRITCDLIAIKCWSRQALILGDSNISQLSQGSRLIVAVEVTACIRKFTILFLVGLWVGKSPLEFSPKFCETNRSKFTENLKSSCRIFSSVVREWRTSEKYSVIHCCEFAESQTVRHAVPSAGDYTWQMWH